MTLNDLISEFEITYDIGSLGLPGFETSEIIKLLELAQYRIISQKFSGNNVYNSKFPETNKRIDDLSNLMVDTDSGVGGGLSWGNSSVTGIDIIVLPDDFLHLVEIAAIYANGEIQYGRQAKYSEVGRFTRGRNGSSPYVKFPVYSFVGQSNGNKRLRIYFDVDYIATNAAATITAIYIKMPTNLEAVGDLDATISDFNDDVYHEIVASAVDHAINIATPNKAQVSQMQLNKSE